MGLKVLAAKPREEWGGDGFSRGAMAAPPPSLFTLARTKPPATQVTKVCEGSKFALLQSFLTSFEC